MASETKPASPEYISSDGSGECSGDSVLCAVRVACECLLAVQRQTLSSFKVLMILGLEECICFVHYKDG